MSFCIPYTVWLIQILDWLLSSDSAKSWPAFHADNIGKNAKAATLDSLCSLKGKKKPHCFPAVVLLSPPCCVHSIGICSLFTALMTGFKNTFLKTELSDREIFSICNSFAGCWVYCSSSWEVPVDRRQRQMHAGDMLTENKTQENNICLGGRSSWRNAGSPELPSLPRDRAPTFNSWEGACVPHHCRNCIHETSWHKKICPFETAQPPVAFYCLKPIHLEHDYLIISQTGQTKISFMTWSFWCIIVLTSLNFPLCLPVIVTYHC